MGALLDGLAIRLAACAVPALGLSGLFALLMIGTRQPARRVFLARFALGTLVLVAGVTLGAGPPVLLRGVGRHVAEVPPAWRRAMAAACLGGWLVSAGWMGLGWAALGRVERRARPVGREADEGTRRALAGSGVRAAFSPHLARPIAAGWFRPRLLLPASYEAGLGAEPLRLALAHELAHCRRRDVPFSALGQLASASWFFLPPVRWIERQMRVDQEFLADRDAVERLGRGPLPYAATLVDLAAGSTAGRPGMIEGPAPRLGDGGALAPGSLSARLAMLLSGPFPIEARVPGWYRGGFALACGLAALGASLLLGPRGALVPRRANPLPAPAPRFAAPSLILQTSGPEGGGQGVATVVPVRLPPAFDLRLDVDTALVERLDAELGGVHIRAIPRGMGDDAGLHRWTPVRLRRGPDGDHAWVDGLPVPATPAAGAGADDRLTLAFRDVDGIALRNLVLQW